MSERKTAEIKFRVEPSVKARWQAAADAAGCGLSEFIRQSTESCIEQARGVTMLDADTSQFSTKLAERPPVECSVMPSGCWALKAGRPCPCNPKSEYQVIDKPLPETERTEQAAPSEPYGSSWKPFGTDRVG